MTTNRIDDETMASEKEGGIGLGLGHPSRGPPRHIHGRGVHRGAPIGIRFADGMMVAASESVIGRRIQGRGQGPDPAHGGVRNLESTSAFVGETSHNATGGAVRSLVIDMAKDGTGAAGLGTLGTRGRDGTGGNEARGTHGTASTITTDTESQQKTTIGLVSWQRCRARLQTWTWIEDNGWLP
jgi:hypothetical protein